MKHTFSACCCAILISISAQAQKGASHFEIDTRTPLQTMDGFGASDAWSMQHIGLWPDSVRLQTADWLFSTENDSKGQAAMTKDAKAASAHIGCARDASSGQTARTTGHSSPDNATSCAWPKNGA